MRRLPFVLAVTVPAALLAITGAEWASRHLAIPPQFATRAALVAAIGCVAGDLNLLSAALLGHSRLSHGPAGVNRAGGNGESGSA